MRGRPWAARIVGWVLVPALGAALRLAPAWMSPGDSWTGDAAGHYRWVAWLLEHGRLPAVDPLSDLPDGRDLGRFLPLGLYHAAALWHRLAGGVAAVDLGGSLQTFIAIAGGLVAWPVWVAARALGTGRWSACLAGLVAVTLPAHLDRTTAFQLRYDALGTLLITAHLALGMAALAASARTRIVTCSALSGVALFAALGVWRVPLVVPAFEAATVVCLAIGRPPSWALRIWFGATGLALLAASAGFEYLRAQQAALSIPILPVLVVAGAMPLVASRPIGSHALARTGILVASVGVAVALSLGARARLAGDYGSMWELIRLRTLWRAGLDPGASVMAAVLLTVRELQPMSVAALAGPAGFSWLGAWLPCAAALLAFVRRRLPRPGGPGGTDSAVLALGVTLGLLGITLLANRHRVLLAPLAAAFAGYAVACLSQALASPGRERNRRRWPATRIVAALGLAALVPCLVMLVRDSWWAATHARSRPDPGWVAALAYVRDHAGNRPVLSLWEMGYELQRVAGCATLTDGLLESPVNQTHIREAARALLQPTPDALAALAERFGVGLVVLPPSPSLFGVTIAAGDPLALKIAAREPLDPADADRVVIRMMAFGSAEPPFVPVFARDGYRVYRRTPRPTRAP